MSRVFSPLGRALRALAVVSGVALVAGCAAPPRAYDYSAFRAAKPASILVLPPINATPDILATPSVWSQVTRPLAESGYYVVPVSLVNETFRNQGVPSPEEAQQIALPKLREIFGADAGLYIKVNRFGSVYRVINSETVVALEAKLIDLRDGQLLWQGQASASSAEQSQGNQGGVVGLLLQAVIEQVIASTTDRSHGMAGMASQRLLMAGPPNRLLWGPRSPRFGGL